VFWEFGNAGWVQLMGPFDGSCIFDIWVTFEFLLERAEFIGMPPFRYII
jgi:hypothetical protein